MTKNKRFEFEDEIIWENTERNSRFEIFPQKAVELLNELSDENEQLKKELKRCKDWINSDKYDYELTLAFIKNKGYSLKDVLEYEKVVKLLNKGDVE